MSAIGLRSLLWRSARLSFAITVLLITLALRIRFAEEDAMQRTGTWVLAYLMSVLVVGTWLAVRSTRRTWSSYRLDISVDGLRRTQYRLAEIAIAPGEVTEVEEIPGRGMVVRTADPEKFIFVPAGLGDYSTVRDQISQWAPLRRLSQSASWVRQWVGVTSALVVVGWMVATLMSQSAAFVVPSAFAISVFLLWTFIAAQRSLHLDRRMKLAMWFVVFPILVLTMKSTQLLIGLGHP